MSTLKRFASALTVCALLATTSLVASADDSASLYQTTNGGPTHLSETLEIYKNTGNSYYAECTYIMERRKLYRCSVKVFVREINDLVYCVFTYFAVQLKHQKLR